MTILLALCVLLAAGWLLASVLRGASGDPRGSVDGFSRALGALDPKSARRRQPQRRRVQRPARR